MRIKDLVDRKRADPALRQAFAVADVARMAGDLARRMRLGADRTQGEIAAELDCSQPRVSQIESTKVENLPPLDTLARFAVACGDRLVLTTASEMDALRAERDALKAALDEQLAADAGGLYNPLRVRVLDVKVKKPAGENTPRTTVSDNGTE